MTLSDKSKQPPSRPKNAVARDKVVPAHPEEADRTFVDDQASYNAAVSEGWPVSPRLRRWGRKWVAAHA